MFVLIRQSVNTDEHQCSRTACTLFKKAFRPRIVCFSIQGGEGVTSHQDDEYRWAGVSDPKIRVTTSRDPSSRLKQFAKEIKLLLPNAQRLNRGGYEIHDLVKACVANEVTDLVLLHETRGDPDQIGKDEIYTDRFA